MESLTSRWNRKKVEAIERARVFDVEERDGRFTLTKRHSPFLPQIQGSVLAGLGWMFVNWQIFQSPVNRSIAIGWVIMWMLFGPLFAFFSVLQIWKIRRGEVWVLNRGLKKLEHNNQVVLYFDQIRSVRAITTHDGASHALLLNYRNSKTLVLDDMGMHAEHLRVGHQIADFLGVRFNPPYW